MALKLYELTGQDDRRFSPYCWRTLMALHHKGLTPERVPCRFTEKERIAFSGQGKVPVLSDGEAVVNDSWAIACHLESAYPDRPALFPGGEATMALSGFFNRWTDSTINPVVLRLVIGDLFEWVHEADRDYFRRTREARLGDTLENSHAARHQYRDSLDAALQPLEASLAEQSFISGSTAAYPDYILFGTLQWARLVSPLDLLSDAPRLQAWRERLLDRFDGLGRSVPAAA